MPGLDMRILFIDCAPFMGGAQESLWTLLAELHRRGADVGLLCACHELEKRSQSYNIPCERFAASHWPATPRGLLAFLGDRRRAAPAIRRATAAFTPEIVVFNTVRAALLAPPPTAPCVIHDRDIRMPAAVPWLLSRKCRDVIAVSECVAAKWRRIPPVRTAVIHNMFDVAGMAALPQRPPEGAVPRLALVADFVAWKNHGDFIRAAEQLRKDGESFQAVLKGRLRGPASERCLEILQRDIRRRRLEDCIAINAAHETALAAMEQADIVLSTATDEPFGRTAIEALALGKPFVAYDSGGFAEILRDCPAATLVPKRDVNALETALKSWMTTVKQQNIPDKARQFAQNFDISAITPIFIEFFSRILRCKNH